MPGLKTRPIWWCALRRRWRRRGARRRRVSTGGHARVFDRVHRIRRIPYNL